MELKDLEPEIVGVCVFESDIEKFAKEYIKFRSDVDVEVKVIIKKGEKEPELLVSLNSEILTQEDDEDLLEMSIDKLDPVHNGKLILGELIEEIDGSNILPNYGEDEEQRKYIIVEVPFDSYMEEMGYKR
ncbi:hypothetical protein [Evansella tamaricis]|uniref:Uncharacterized protein n=1 Tax=Evansella tamaricis TaxID=2069301 RepID=A0ABS6JBI3_9BACI|nr:hypothetical protein [Evansella tamaricis]MBU9710544.1 hypothetical protein [Evansella tamaricis]